MFIDSWPYLRKNRKQAKFTVRVNIKLLIVMSRPFVNLIKTQHHKICMHAERCEHFNINWPWMNVSQMTIMFSYETKETNWECQWGSENLRLRYFLFFKPLGMEQTLFNPEPFQFSFVCEWDSHLPWHQCPRLHQVMAVPCWPCHTGQPHNSHLLALQSLHHGPLKHRHCLVHLPTGDLGRLTMYASCHRERMLPRAWFSLTLLLSP